MTLSATAPRAEGLGAVLAKSETLVALYFGLLGLMTLPVILFPTPRVADFVNHWARLTTLRMSADDPLKMFYDTNWGAIPNLGIDILYMALSPALGPQSVARLALALSIWLPALGALALHRGFTEGKVSPTILLTPLLSYNVFTSCGFVNFGMGVGLSLLTLAFAERCDRFRWRDLLALNLFAIAIFFCHVLALAGFCLLFGLLRATPRPGERLAQTAFRALVSPAYVAAALLLVAVRPAMPKDFHFVSAKSWLLLAGVYNGLDFDFQCGGMLLAGVVVLMILMGVRIAPRARFAAPGFVMLAALAPSASGATILIDARLLAFGFYFALSACLARDPRRLAPVLAPAALLFALMRLSLIALSWHAFEGHVAELRQAFQTIPTGSRVLVVTPEGCDDTATLFEYNLSNFAVIDRRSSTSMLFAGSGMQPIRSRDEKLATAPQTVMSALWLSPEGRARLGEAAALPWADAFVHWRDHFDVVVDVHGECQGDLALPDFAASARSAFADVYLPK